MPLKNGKAPKINPKKPLKKGDSGLGSSKDKAVQKGHLKKKTLRKGKLWKKNLIKLPQMTLAEKMEVAAEEAEGDEDLAAMNLKKSMIPAERQSVWSKHQTHLEHNPKDAKALQKASKNENGIAAAKWLMQKDGKNYADDGRHVKQTRVDHQKFILVSHKEALKKLRAPWKKLANLWKRVLWKKQKGLWKKALWKKNRKTFEKIFTQSSLCQESAPKWWRETAFISSSAMVCSATFWAVPCTPWSTMRGQAKDALCHQVIDWERFSFKFRNTIQSKGVKDDTS